MAHGHGHEHEHGHTWTYMDMDMTWSSVCFREPPSRPLCRPARERVLTGYGDDACGHGTRARTRKRHERGPTRNHRFSAILMPARSGVRPDRAHARAPQVARARAFSARACFALCGRRLRGLSGPGPAP
eukprot:1510942-Prymnesium_polylepis.2